MGDIGMSEKDSIQVHAASFARRGKFIANVVRQFGRFMIDMLFRNCEDLGEVSLDGCFDGAVTLDGFQMYCAQDDKGRCGQNYCQLQSQEQPEPLVFWPFRFHPGFLIRTLMWISPALTIVQWGRAGVKQP
jgi:hypothetical protein